MPVWQSGKMLFDHVILSRRLRVQFLLGLFNFSEQLDQKLTKSFSARILLGLLGLYSEFSVRIARTGSLTRTIRNS